MKFKLSFVVILMCVLMLTVWLIVLFQAKAKACEEAGGVRVSGKTGSVCIDRDAVLTP